MQKIDRYTSFIKQEALKLGFSQCNIARAVPLDEDARRLEEWLARGYHGKMAYMENHFDLRVDPGKLVPGARSVITLLLNYFPAVRQGDVGSTEDVEVPANARATRDAAPKISKYAYGEDYHEVIREKLKFLLGSMRENIGEVNGRGFVDSAPVLERSWAARSGLGWIGRNGNLITKDGGSFFFIATLITDLDLNYDDPFVKDYCGTCTKCIDTCPTDAILPDRVINGSKCISYFTIELKDMVIPDEMKGKFNDWMFGCDICQDVCPWNRFSKPTTETAFQPINEVLNLSTSEWEQISEEAFKKIFKHSPIKRAKHGGIMRNLKFIRK